LNREVRESMDDDSGYLDEDDNGDEVDPDLILAALDGHVRPHTGQIAPGQWVVGGRGQAGRVGAVLEVARIADPDEPEVEVTCHFFYRSPDGEWQDAAGAGSAITEWPLPRPTIDDDDVTVEDIPVGEVRGVWLAALVGLASAAVARLDAEYAGTSHPVEIPPSGLFVAPFAVFDATQTLGLVAFDAQGQERGRHEVTLFDRVDAALKWPHPSLWPE